jgi:ABC-type transport system involved in Fe-S cluster assembly fused permease/ATPase subunit
VPVLLKQIVDDLAPRPAGAPLLAVPLGLLVAYGALRLASTLFTELREFVFAKVTQRAVRTIALQVFRHLHALSLRFHLERQTGGLTRDIERGTRGISSWCRTRCTRSCRRWSRSAGDRLPAVCTTTCGSPAITGGALALYIVFTVAVTEWRTQFRRR